jgi:hypothetical protein
VRALIYDGDCLPGQCQPYGEDAADRARADDRDFHGLLLRAVEPL